MQLRVKNREKRRKEEEEEKDKREKLERKQKEVGENKFKGKIISKCVFFKL